MTGRELTRRTFITGALAAAGLAPGASSLVRRHGVPSHRGATAADSSRRDERVLIIGAGMAGLAAAAELQALGFGDVAILEARDRIGGRLWTNTIGGNIPVDLGASWIHGVDGNPITAIARANGIATHPTDYDNDVEHFHNAERPSPSAGRALRRFWRLAEGQPGTNLQSVYEQLLEIEPLTAPDRRYLDYLLNTIVEHEHAADLRSLSLESIQGGDEYGGHDAVFPGGYGQVAYVLADGLDVRFREAVTEIDYAVGARIPGPGGPTRTCRPDPRIGDTPNWAIPSATSCSLPGRRHTSSSHRPCTARFSRAFAQPARSPRSPHAVAREM